MVTRVRWMAALAAVMLCLSMPAQSTPQNGWWWNPAENGRGFFLEWQDDQLFIAGYFYADDGRPTWMFSGGTMSSPQTYSGTLYSVSGGQTLMGNYVAPATFANVGTLWLDFTDHDVGTLTWPGGTIPIQRHVFANGEASFQPTGWWWNPDESGRGFSVEVQGDTLFMAGFMYDGAGNPVWYFSSGKLTTAQRYRGTLLRATGGQTIGGSYRPPAAIVPAGQVSIEFTSEETARMVVSDQPPAAAMVARASAGGDRAVPADEDLAPLVGRQIDLRRQMRVRGRLQVTPDSFRGELKKEYFLTTPTGYTKLLVKAPDVLFQRTTSAGTWPAKYRLTYGRANILYELVFAPSGSECRLSATDEYDLARMSTELTLSDTQRYSGSGAAEVLSIQVSGTCAGNFISLPPEFVSIDFEIGPADLVRGAMEGQIVRSGGLYNLLYVWKLIPYAN